MFEALVITLREGVEAALVLAIALSLIDRGGLGRLRGALFAGAAAALAASIAVAALAARITYNEELAEGIAKLTGAVLVVALVWWMWKSAPHLKREIESGIQRGGGSWSGLFLFSFGMVFREGVETAIFLSASGFNSAGVARWLGALAGLLLAAIFGVLFARGTLRTPLKPFFSITSAVLILIAFQLLVGGLHELSEAQVLPSSRAEMALVGPIIKNELLLFTLTVALAAGWLLFGPSSAAAPAPSPDAEGAEARLARAGAARERARRRWTGMVALVVVGLLATAFALTSRVPDRPPAEPLAVSSGEVTFDAAPLADGRARFYEVPAPAADGAPGVAVRFFALEVNGQVRTCLDACEICGDKGYFQDHGALVCRNCTSPIAASTVGRPGGCNPVPLPSRREGARVVVRVADLAAKLPLLKGR